MDECLPGNRVDGIAVIEAPNTTLFVPEGWRVEIDAHRIYWMTRTGARARRAARGRGAE